MLEQDLLGQAVMGMEGSQQLLIALEALSGRPAHDGSYGAPLRGHELGKVEQLLILFPGPLRLLDAGVQPLIPAGLALLGGFPHQQGGNPGPLIQPILHDCCLQDFVLHRRAETFRQGKFAYVSTTIGEKALIVTSERTPKRTAQGESHSAPRLLCPKV